MFFEFGLTAAKTSSETNNNQAAPTDALVTQATSGENPSMWSFSLSKTFWETNMGK